MRMGGSGQNMVNVIGGHVLASLLAFFAIRRVGQFRFGHAPPCPRIQKSVTLGSRTGFRFVVPIMLGAITAFGDRTATGKVANYKGGFTHTSCSIRLCSDSH